MTRRRLLALGTAVALVLCGCATPPPDGNPDRVLPPAGGAFDYQLGGSYDPPAGVEVVARDSTEKPAEGVYNICYVNGFQTQPGDAGFWLDQHPGLVLRDAEGEPVADPGWPDEYLLDTSGSASRDAIAGILAEVTAGCSDAGFDAVEFDNLDSWTRSGGALTLDDNLALARELVLAAHEAGLAAAQKNSAGESERFRDEVGFDFAVTEECARYDECSDYTDAYGDLVFDIEYSAEFLVDACATVASAILRDRDLTTPDDPAYVFEGC
jgi:hypothetical protein